MYHNIKKNLITLKNIINFVQNELEQNKKASKKFNTSLNETGRKKKGLRKQMQNRGLSVRV